MPTNILFFCFVLILALPFARVLERPERIYEYPSFMAATFAVFILPQAISLTHSPGPVCEPAVRRVLAVAFLCAISSLAGYHMVKPALCFRNQQPLNSRRLRIVSILFVACGLFMNYLLGAIEIRVSDFGGWTGSATVCGFFQQLAYPGFAICLFLMLRRPTLISFTLLACAAIVPIQSVAFARREPAVILAISIGMVLHFQSGVRPPRWLITTSISIAMLAIPATTTYRQLRFNHDWAGLRHVNYLDNFLRFLNEESPLELRNAAMLIDATQRSGCYQFGVGYWNHLVFRFVPAQFLGESFKNSLLLTPDDSSVQRELATIGYTNPVGSTVTGLGDSFQQFGFYGCLFFAFLGVFFNRLWHLASAKNALFHQLFYISSCTSAMRAVTHWTLDFLPGICFAAIFLGAAAWFVRSGPPELSLEKSTLPTCSPYPRKHARSDVRTSLQHRRPLTSPTSWQR